MVDLYWETVTPFMRQVMDTIGESELASLASVLDIGLMKLDAVATRAGRKDFYDLCAIAQQVPLRELLQLAPRKYAPVRDYASMVTPYLVFFERAEQEETPNMIQEIEWEAVKAFFQAQTVSLANEWLE